jgi:hypothetical protein
VGEVPEVVAYRHPNKINNNWNIIFKKQLDTNIITSTYICPYLIVIKPDIAF